MMFPKSEIHNPPNSWNSFELNVAQIPGLNPQWTCNATSHSRPSCLTPTRKEQLDMSEDGDLHQQWNYKKTIRATITNLPGCFSGLCNFFPSRSAGSIKVKCQQVLLIFVFNLLFLLHQLVLLYPCFFCKFNQTKKTNSKLACLDMSPFEQEF